MQKKIKDRWMEEGRQPDNIEDLIEMVEEASDDLSEDVIRRSVANIRKRARQCLNSDKPGPGGHFQHLR